MAKKTTTKSITTSTTSKSTGNGNGHRQTFSLNSPGAVAVQLVGDFTQWQQHPIPLKKGSDGLWLAEIELPPGVHHYRFMVDGQWCDDPNCKSRSANPFGGENMTRQVA
ncbi:MAG TPA: glycogen-binding domain-containing protein [Verrucomicrobiae bacterium]|jgi:1,4-alpha-glucan branching enzyme